jgi:phosphomevalonate kinase
MPIAQEKEELANVENKIIKLKNELVDEEKLVVKESKDL